MLSTILETFLLGLSPAASFVRPKGQRSVLGPERILVVIGTLKHSGRSKCAAPVLTSIRFIVVECKDESRARHTITRVELHHYAG